MKIVDTKSGSGSTPFRVRVNRTGRRTYSREYKLEIVEECRAPGASLAAVALSHRINANVVRKWVVQHEAGRLCVGGCAKPALLPVTVAPDLRGAPVHASSDTKEFARGVIEIEFERARLRVRGAVDEAALRTVLEVLVRS
jgi:transposase